MNPQTGVFDYAVLAVVIVFVLFFYMTYRLFRFGPVNMWLPGGKKRHRRQREAENRRIKANVLRKMKGQKLPATAPKGSAEALRQAEEDEKLIAAEDKKFRKAKKVLSSALGTGLDEVLQNLGGELKTYTDHENKLKLIIQNPAILDTYSDADLDNLRIRLQTELNGLDEAEAINGGKLVTANHEVLEGLANSMAGELIHNRQLVMNLVLANQKRRTSPQQPLIGPGRRKQLSDEIQELITERNDTVQNLNRRNATQDEIKQMENIYDDAIQRKQLELRKLMAP
jgi:hypothetical protein